MSPPRDERVICEEDLRDLQALAQCTSSDRDRQALADLCAQLAQASVVPRAALPQDVVCMGANVEFENEATRRRQVVQLVYPSWAELSRGLVSVLTPVGSALLGLRAGESLEWPVPSGWVEVRILRVTQRSFAAPPRLR